MAIAIWDSAVHHRPVTCFHPSGGIDAKAKPKAAMAKRAGSVAGGRSPKRSKVRQSDKLCF